MTQQELLPPHDHCVVCDMPVDVGEKFCGDACKAADEVQKRKEKRNNYLFLGGMAAALVIVTIISLVLKG
jgi:predicted nucleic acid-binding Zn ribbon protein